VGNNQVGEPWLDESLAQYSVEVYFRERYGANAGRGVRDSYEATVDGYLAEGGERMPVGLPVEAYREDEYFVYVYNAGPLLFSHFTEDYGEEAVSELLAAYYSRFQYEVAHTSDLEQFVEAQLGPEALDLFEQWVYGE
jgi:aminopeptidase N